MHLRSKIHYEVQRKIWKKKKRKKKKQKNKTELVGASWFHDFLDKTILKLMIFAF